jgi:hypothetical protein
MRKAWDELQEQPARTRSMMSGAGQGLEGVGADDDGTDEAKAGVVEEQLSLELLTEEHR